MVFVSILCLGIAQTSNPSQGLRSDDDKVVGTAMLEFFKKTDWSSGSWARGEVIAVRPQWSKKERPNFVQELDDALKFYGAEPKAKADVDKLRRIKADWTSTVVGYEPAPLGALKAMSLPKKVVVGELDYGDGLRYGWSSGKFKVKGAPTGTGTARVIASLTPPAYARNGRYAVLTASVPWSIHSADLKFFMKRTEDGWTVEVVVGIYYA